MTVGGVNWSPRFTTTSSGRDVLTSGAAESQKEKSFFFVAHCLKISEVPVASVSAPSGERRYALASSVPVSPQTRAAKEKMMPNLRLLGKRPQGQGVVMSSSKKAKTAASTKETPAPAESL